MTTCTVRVHADGTPCGAPAVATFKSARTGETFGECVDHLAPGYEVAPALVAGARVHLMHAGIAKTGTVVALSGASARVEIALADGTTKTIRRPAADLILA